MQQFLLFQGVEQITIKGMQGKLQMELNAHWTPSHDRYKQTEKLGVNAVLIGDQVRFDIEIKPEETVISWHPPKHLEVLVRKDREYAIIR